LALDRALAAGPGWLLGQVPLEPVRGKDRQFLGFRVVSVFADDPRALAYGVLPGDLLVRIQGQRIVTPGDLMTVFQRLRGAAEIIVELQRGREPLTLRWPVVDPAQTGPVP
jgi:type II secretory pathway component PulC